MFIGAGILGKSSWLDCKIVENFEEVDFRPEYPWGPGGRSSKEMRFELQSLGLR